MKSRKKKQNKSDKQELDIDDLGTSFIIVEDKKKKAVKRKPLEQSFKNVVKDSMIDRKATQAEIDIDKKIRELLATGYYNHNQIAGMIKGANLERVKKVSNERK